MKVKWVLLPFLVVSAFAEEKCSRKPIEAKDEKHPGDNGYSIEVKNAGEGRNDTDGLVPGETYLVTIQGWSGEHVKQTFRGFVLTAHNEHDRPAGTFEIPKEKSEVRQAPSCRVVGVSHANLQAKVSVSLKWRAPETSTGCVLFRASVLESKNLWYADEGKLTVKLCVNANYEPVLPVDSASAECCACDLAKYNLEFIGLWSRETHPRDYPTLEHLTHFTDMFGASHSSNYSLWEFGKNASDGLKEIAEWGNTYQAEKEAKEQASEVRTMMKMKGLWYPEVQGRTNTTFVVNKYHHFASLVAMFGPSPDWCVGISTINLCLPDCTWIGERSFDLLPWDAGTDNGTTYMSPNSPIEPRQPIAKITTKSDPKSPFYDANSNSIPPIARIVIKRIETTPSRCRKEEEYKREAYAETTTSEDDAYLDRRECAMSDWDSWTLCSATCGKGIRMRSRVYRFPAKAQMFGCQRQTTERQFCNANINECVGSEVFDSKCAVGSWDDWTVCSEKCGNGTRTRKRSFIDSNTNATECSVELEQQESCIGPYGEDCSVTPDPLCRTTDWSEYSQCSASCDKGVKVRTRLLYYSEQEAHCSHVKLMEKEDCTLQECKRFSGALSAEKCSQPKSPGPCHGVFPKYWYNSVSEKCERFIFGGCRGNDNQFDTENECRRACVPGYSVDRPNVPNSHLDNEFGGDEVNDGGAPVNCELSEWSPWGSCSTSCGKGKRTRSRNIKVFPRNGGNSCPEHIIQEHTCHQRPCPLSGCSAGLWSRWSTCSVTGTGSCGAGTKSRTRKVHKARTADGDDGEECQLTDREVIECNVPCPTAKVPA